ncbi:MAG: GNAT family N-acetyltransferase [Nocardioides sp.]
MTDVLHDPRVAPVEDNLVDFLRLASARPGFGHDGHPDLDTWHTAVPHPIFNGICGARFAPEDEARRTREALAPYLERGLPFLWWGTPSSMTPTIAATLLEAGLVADVSPGMHLDLRGLVATAPLARGVRIRVATHAELPVVAAVMAEGFDFPTEMVAPILRLMAPVEDRTFLHVLAELDGTPVAVGTAWVTGTTVGLYNIATLEAARGRGIGYAVTAALLEAGRGHGCTDAVLHATEMGRPVYERLGFDEVCSMPMFVWLPGWGTPA